VVEESAGRRPLKRVKHVAQHSAGPREFLAVPSSSGQDSHFDSSPSAKDPAVAVGPQPFMNATQAFGSMLPSSATAAPEAAREASDLSEALQSTPEPEAMHDASDGPLAAWYALQDDCVPQPALSTSITDASVDIVGGGRQEVDSHAYRAAAQPCQSHPGLTLGPLSRGETSDDHDIEIDFGSPSPAEPLAMRSEAVQADPGTLETTPTSAPQHSTSLQSLEGQPCPALEPPEQAVLHSPPRVELHLDLCLPSSRQSDVSPSQYPEAPLPSASQPQETGSAPEAHGEPSRPSDGPAAGVAASIIPVLAAAAKELTMFRPRRRPPSSAQLQVDMDALGLHEVVHQPAFYGNPDDVPSRPVGEPNPALLGQCPATW
jgi:hypothetical protein